MGRPTSCVSRTPTTTTMRSSSHIHPESDPSASAADEADTARGPPDAAALALCLVVALGCVRSRMGQPQPQPTQRPSPYRRRGVGAARMPMIARRPKWPHAAQRWPGPSWRRLPRCRSRTPLLYGTIHGINDIPSCSTEVGSSWELGNRACAGEGSRSIVTAACPRGMCVIGRPPRSRSRPLHLDGER